MKLCGAASDMGYSQKRKDLKHQSLETRRIQSHLISVLDIFYRESVHYTLQSWKPSEAMVSMGASRLMQFDAAFCGFPWISGKREMQRQVIATL